MLVACAMHGRLKRERKNPCKWLQPEPIKWFQCQQLPYAMEEHEYRST